MTRVLIVDDDQAIRETLRFLLEDAGYEVIEAEDGRTALEFLRACDCPMVVLLDLMMPRMNGFQLLSVVALDPRVLSTHAYIMITASPLARQLVFGRNRYPMALSYVDKPFDLDELLGEIKRAASRIDQAAISEAVGITQASEVRGRV